MTRDNKQFSFDWNALLEEVRGKTVVINIIPLYYPDYSENGILQYEKDPSGYHFQLDTIQHNELVTIQTANSLREGMEDLYRIICNKASVTQVSNIKAFYCIRDN